MAFFKVDNRGSSVMRRAPRATSPAPRKQAALPPVKPESKVKKVSPSGGGLDLDMGSDGDKLDEQFERF
jgi:hypothetical protein